MISRRAKRQANIETGAPVDDAVLVRRAQADPKAFADLYDRYVDPVYRVCYRRLQSVPAAEDATSTTFFNALAALHSFNPREKPFRSWLFAIAHNAVFDQFRSRQRRPEESLEAANQVIDRDPLPDEQAVARDEARRLRSAIGALTTDQQRVMELRLTGLNGPEIAAALGRSPGAIRITQHRAIQRLRRVLNPRQEATSNDKESSHE